MHRVFAAIFASGLTSFCLYPLDALQTSRQVASFPLGNKIAGRGMDLCSTCLTTGVYFFCYEHTLEHYPPAIAAGLSVMVSSTVNTPLSIRKRRALLTRNGYNSLPPLTVSQFRNTLALNVMRKLPKNIIKYHIYEHMLKLLMVRWNPAVCGAVAAFIAASLSNLLFSPLEIMRIRASLGLSFLKRDNWKQFFAGAELYMLHSVLANTLGHAVLELFSPRKVF